MAKKKVEAVTKKTGKKAPALDPTNANDAMTLRYQAIQKAVEAGKQVSPISLSAPIPRETLYSSTPELTPTELATYGVTLGNQPGQVAPSTVVPIGPGVAGTAPAVGSTPPVGGFPSDFKPVVPPPPPGSKEPSGPSAEMKDAFAMLKDLFMQYDLEELLPAINELMVSGVGPAAATLALKTDPKYNKDAAGNPIGYARRFAGNELRRKQGLNVLSEAEYLALENSYSETLTAYGLVDYFGPKGRERTQKMAEVIGANISAVEFNDRVNTSYSRVINTDKATRDSFKLLYGITDSDLTRYFLDPKNNVNVLKEKVTTAEIYGSAVAQGLAGSLEISTELAKLGVDKQLARQGYSVIAEVLPEATKLSQIYEELPAYTQQTAEAEVFRGLASAQRTRQRLVQRETAEFSGESGLSTSALDRQVGGRI